MYSCIYIYTFCTYHYKKPHQGLVITSTREASISVSTYLSAIVCSIITLINI